MKKLLSLIIVVSLVLSPALVVFARGNGNSSINEKEKAIKTEKVENVQSELKTFKFELNEQKKLISENAGTLDSQKLALEAQYQELLTAGNTAEAESLLQSIDELDMQMKDLQAQLKQINNERYMLTKSNYTEEELSQFENAAGLIEKLYADAEILGLGSVIIKDNIIKLDGPAYIKGGRTIIPVRAITEGLGATVVWNPETKSVTISKDGIEINLTMGSSTVLVNGVEQQIDAKAEITNSRTYVPLRFIAETFGLITNWDGENNVIDIEEGTDEVQETSDSAIDISTDVPAQADEVND